MIKMKEQKPILKIIGNNIILLYFLEIFFGKYINVFFNYFLDFGGTKELK